jgi:putative ABC transport system ATP-binding protein
MQPAIAVRELKKTYAEGRSGVTALRGVNLDANAGELLMLMGPSGSGKTTLLSIMGCILSATSFWPMNLLLRLIRTSAATLSKC